MLFIIEVMIKGIYAAYEGNYEDRIDNNIKIYSSRTGNPRVMAVTLGL